MDVQSNPSARLKPSDSEMTKLSRAMVGEVKV